MPSRRREPAYAILSGIAVGAIVTVLVLATSPAPAEYPWPPVSQVEGYTVHFTEDGSVTRGGTGRLPSDCTRMLVDLTSTVPVTLWVTDLAGASVPSNGTPPSIPSYNYWSGSAAVTVVSTVVAMAPPDTFWMVVYDGDEYPTGTASFGFWFSASDCPIPA